MSEALGFFLFLLEVFLAAFLVAMAFLAASWSYLAFQKSDLAYEQVKQDERSGKYLKTAEKNTKEKEIKGSLRVAPG